MSLLITVLLQMIFVKRQASTQMQQKLQKAHLVLHLPMKEMIPKKAAKTKQSQNGKGLTKGGKSAVNDKLPLIHRVRSLPLAKIRKGQISLR